MDLLTTVIQRGRRDFFKWRYLRAARGILHTKPLAVGAIPFLLLSMVQKSDVISYLVAVKSFAMHANPQRIVVVCDPSIDGADRAVFRQHIPHIELRDAAEFFHESVPRGGTWERLLAISIYVVDNYVVQLDADTVTTNAIPEVLAAISNGTGFVIGEEPDQQPMSLAKTHQLASQFDTPDNHVQDVAELKMIELGRPDSEFYIRGCSGFTGFPQANNMQEKLHAYSEQMGKLVGKRWTAWGTEQVTSNYLIANMTGTRILPLPKYAAANLADSQSIFLHFSGYTRFVDAKYENNSKHVIRALTVINSI